MNNPILIVGHAALPSNLCSGIIDMHEQAPFTELKSMEDDGHVEPMNEEDHNRVKFTNNIGVTYYTILGDNPYFNQIMEFLQWEILKQAKEINWCMYVKLNILKHNEQHF